MEVGAPGHLLGDIAHEAHLVQGQLVLSSRALHDDQYRDHEAGYDNCHDEDSDDNFDDGDAGLDLHDGGEEGLRVEEARQPHRDRQVEVCSPSFQLTVIIMRIILNMTLMTLYNLILFSIFAFGVDNGGIQTWVENCI